MFILVLYDVSRHHSAKVLSTNIGNFIFASTTDLWRHLTSNSRGTWHTEWLNGLVCYGYKLAVSWLNWRVGHGRGKWMYSKCIFRNESRNGNGKVPNNILPFSRMFHIADFFSLIFKK